MELDKHGWLIARSHSMPNEIKKDVYNNCYQDCAPIYDMTIIILGRLLAHCKRICRFWDGGLELKNDCHWSSDP